MTTQLLAHQTALQRTIIMKRAVVFCIAIFIARGAYAQTADTVLLNGKIFTVDRQFSTQEAIAIRDGKILAVGKSADIRKLSGANSRVIDLHGRTVIPGLIDSHLHGIRAALSFSTEVNWIGASSIDDALGRIRQAAGAMKPGSWLIVAGGWNVQQFKEKRLPTQAELVAAAPDNPVYVQLGYGWALMTPAGYKAMNIVSEADLPAGGRFEKGPDGRPTGAITGGQNAIIALFDKLPQPSADQQVEGTKKFFRELNRLGMTGFVDPGGNNLSTADYAALFKVWRGGEMTVRVAFALNGQTPGKEFEEYRTFTSLLPMGFGDEMLKFNGIGERITFGMNNNDRPTQAQKDEYYQIVKWAAERGLGLTMHWNRDASVDELLTLFEKLNKEVPITGLRWSVAHLNDASEKSLQRMKALGMGWTVQDAMYFGGEQFQQQNGVEAARRVPPVNTAKRLGVPVGAGTDAHRVASYNPFTALQWFLDGKTVAGIAIRGPEETPTRADALRLYTLGSAWFSQDERKRGSLEPGKFADLAVLSKDYMTVPVDQIGSIESVLTMVGGKIVYETQ
jgi:predicted amidohydrolase YtcJ